MTGRIEIDESGFVVTEPMITRGTAFALATGVDVTREFIHKLLHHAITPPKRNGKPTKFDPAVATAVLERMTKGDSLRAISVDPDMPDVATFLDWVAVNGLSKQYARARDAGIESKFEELELLADTATEDNAQAVRLQVDTRKWMLSKMKPERYGDKLSVEHSGSISIATLPDPEVNARAIRLLRTRLEPVFERLIATNAPVTMEDIIDAFRVTPLPGQPLLIEAERG